MLIFADDVKAVGSKKRVLVIKLWWRAEASAVSHPDAIMGSIRVVALLLSMILLCSSVSAQFSREYSPQENTEILQKVFDQELAENKFQRQRADDGLRRAVNDAKNGAKRRRQDRDRAAVRRREERQRARDERRRARDRAATRRREEAARRRG